MWRGHARQPLGISARGTNLSETAPIQPSGFGSTELNRRGLAPRALVVVQAVAGSSPVAHPQEDPGNARLSSFAAAGGQRRRADLVPILRDLMRTTFCAPDRAESPTLGDCRGEHGRLAGERLTTTSRSRTRSSPARRVASRCTRRGTRRCQSRSDCKDWRAHTLSGRPARLARSRGWLLWQPPRVLRVRPATPGTVCQRVSWWPTTSASPAGSI